MSDAVLKDARTISSLVAKIGAVVGQRDRPLAFMEVCGTHTHAIASAGLRRLLPKGIRLVSGPGCPVCVTPVGYLDHAVALGSRPGTTLCTFGDLYRVPSSHGSLELLAASGGRVRIVYSARDSLDVARERPSEDVIFLSIGFETTTPTIAAVLEEAEREGLANFRILVGNKTIPSALRAIARDPETQLDGLLLPGHVSVITGWHIYRFLADELHLPAVVSGFEPAEITRAILELVQQATTGRAEVVNQYGRVVTAEGNRVAQTLVDRYFEPADATWRGLGSIPGSGLALREQWARRDAGRVDIEFPEPQEPAGCRCGDVLKGLIDPPQCPLFGKRCTPDAPVGACMVSSEGSCAAWYRHERLGLELPGRADTQQGG
jgi:hydrogenase expression/formation protein HypD